MPQLSDRIRCSAACLAISLSLATTALAGDWSSFRGDSSLSGVANEVLTPPLGLAWTFSIDEGSESSPAIAGETVYVDADGKPRGASETGMPR